MFSLLLVVPLALLAGTSGRACAAEEEAPPPSPSPSPPWGAAIGATVVVGSLATGGALLARDTQPALQSRGLYVLAGGLAVAPWVSHAVDRRWRRAVAFGLLSLGTSVATVAESQRANVFDNTVGSRNLTPFIALLTAAVFGSAVGVADSFLHDR